MGRLRLAWTILLVGLAVCIAGVYLMAGLAWGLIGAGIELVAIGVIVANMGDES